MSTTNQGTEVGTTQLKAKEMTTTMTTHLQSFIQFLTLQVTRAKKKLKLEKLKTTWQSSKQQSISKHS